jgi:adenylyl-sulfate kinase
MTTGDNLTHHMSHVDNADRVTMLGHHGGVVWLTGLSGSGKSTIAYMLEKGLVAGQRLAFVLDGDNLRHGLNADLGFSPEARDENIRRVGEVAALFANAGVIAIASFISPYEDGRDRARQCVGGERFIEVFLDVSVSVCEQRDPKGLYRRARAGELTDFTGVSAPYERPVSPDVVLDTDALEVHECVERISDRLLSAGILLS